MEELKTEVMDFFVSFFLNKESLLGDSGQTKRKLARHMLKLKSVQSIILNTILKLYPIITDEVVKEKFGYLPNKEASPNAKENKFSVLEYDYAYSASNDARKFLGLYKNLNEKLCIIKDIFSEYTKQELENMDEEIIPNTQTAEESEKLVKHLSKMSEYEPPFFLDIRDISTESWSNHLEAESLLKEEMKAFEKRYEEMVRKNFYKLSWVKEKCGLKIKRLENLLEERFAMHREEFDRILMVYNDKLSQEYETMLREDEILLKATAIDQINDLPSAMKAISTITAAKGILEKKLRNSERIIKGLENKISITVEKNRELFQENALIKEDISKLKSCSLLFVKKTYFIKEHQDICSKLVDKGKFKKLESKLQKEEFEEKKTVEKLIALFNDFRSALSSMALKCDYETKQKLLKIIDSYKIDSTLQEQACKQLEKNKQAEAKLKAAAFQRNPKRRSTAKPSIRNALKEEKQGMLAIEEKSEEKSGAEGRRRNKTAYQKSDLDQVPEKIIPPKIEILAIEENKRNKSASQRAETDRSSEIFRNKSVPSQKIENTVEVTRLPSAKKKSQIFLTETEKISTFLENDKSDKEDKDILSNSLVDSKQDNLNLQSKSKNPSGFLLKEPETPIKAKQEIKINLELPQSTTEIIDKHPTSQSTEATSRSRVKHKIDYSYNNSSKLIRQQTSSIVKSFQDSLYQTLFQHQVNFQLNKNAKLEDLINYQIGENIKLKDLLVSKLKEHFRDKFSVFTQTDSESKINDFYNSYGHLIKGLLLKEKREMGEKNKDSFKKILPVLKKVYEPDETEGKRLLKDWINEETTKISLAIKEYRAEFDIETQSLGIKKLENPAKIWERVIVRRIMDGVDDYITIFLRGYLGTGLFYANKSTIISMLDKDASNELILLIRKIPIQMQELESPKHRKAISTQIIDKWARLIKKSKEIIARKLEKFYDFGDDLSYKFYIMGKYIRYVKYRVKRVREMPLEREVSQDPFTTSFSGLYMREYWYLTPQNQTQRPSFLKNRLIQRKFHESLTPRNRLHKTLSKL
ncbi:unnamed protein product [Blepharisma stoltei]|uniref:Uncharacterized protein n=1 Tax=Blepharisma stoltei TaxID=1481888 RepID=A0AAU9IXI8_9CILI|nr:unnamed protein product [Blepharisma stoltei]